MQPAAHEEESSAPPNPDREKEGEENKDSAKDEEDGHTVKRDVFV